MVSDLMDWRQKVGSSFQAGLDSFGNYVVNHPELALISTLSILSVFALWGVVRQINTWAPRGEAEEMARRKVILDEKYADMIGDGLFDMLHHEEITRHEYKKACRRFGISYGLSDLLVRKNNKRGMTFRIQHNVRTMKLLDESGNPIQPKIPGPKPAEVVPVPQRKEPKRWVSKGKALLRRNVA